MTHKLLAAATLSLAVVSAAIAQTTQPAKISVIPAPTTMQVNAGTFTLSPHTAILASPGTEKEALYLQQALATPTGVTFGRTSTDDPNTPTIKLVLTDAAPAADVPTGTVDETYTLDITPAAATLTAKTTAGLFDAIQTFRQLLPIEAFSTQPRVGIDWTAPCVHIEDAPRYGYRGLHLDCCRHFWPKEFVMRYIDLAAEHKYNYFHWHLTDDQGWRIEIKKYPKLTQVGGWRAETIVGHPLHGAKTFDGIPHGGYYTQEDIREVVAYAAARHVTIMPEIEMPGHARAAVAAYPELGTTGKLVPVGTTWGIEESTFKVDDATLGFCKDVLTEVMDLFPSKLIHCGGDEVLFKEWKNSPEMQAKIKSLGITPDSDPNNPKDVDAEKHLQAYFMEQMDAFLTSKGRRMVGWDEILDGHLAPGATIMSWRGIKGGLAASAAGHDVIMTPGQYCYFDHYQSQDTAHEPLAIGGFLPIESVYEFDPIASMTPEQAKHVLGGQANMWAEYLPTSTQVEYMAYPRECAMAETLWSQNKPGYADFYGRLIPHLKRLGLQYVNFRRLDSASTTKPTSKAQDY